VRWRKLAGDLRATWGRFLAITIAIALALAGVGVVLGARTVLGREIRASYLGTHPADATLVVDGGVDDALLAEVRARPGIEDADARQMIKARVRLRPEDPWQMLVLFVVRDFDALRLDTFTPEHGAWPPPAGAILLERTSPAVMGVDASGGVWLKTPHGEERRVAIAGLVHDAGQAPAWQEHRGVAYTTPDTLAMLGEAPTLHELLVRFSPAPRSIEDVERSASELAGALRAGGHAVSELRVPKLRQHPHQGLMDAAQLVLLGFSFVLLVLAALVVATMMSAMLARQVREIGVMKAVGAGAPQLAGMYAAFVAGLGLVAVAIALPLSYLGATTMIRGIGRMMNLAIADPTIPARVFGAVATLGVLVPLACAAFPIWRATRITVRDALARHGAGRDFVRPSRLPMAIRNALRRPWRLAFTVMLLVAGGALVLAAANVQRGMRQISAKLEVSRHFDLEVRLHDPIAETADLARLPGVRTLEAWSAASAALSHDDHGTGIVRTYPDGGHGSLMLVAPPAGGTTLVELPLAAGRWLAPADTDAVVLGHNAARGAAIGDRITIGVGGKHATWTIVGIVEEVGGGSAFVTEASFRRATGTSGARLLRIATTASTEAERREILAAIERALAERDAAVYYAMPTPLMRSIIDDHVFLVVRAVMVVAALLALVGLIGLGSAMAINVAERTREIGIMKAIGAGNSRIFRIIVGEALFVGVASTLVAAALALPITMAIGSRLTLLVRTTPFAISLPALLGWLLAVGLGSLLASVLPARRAIRLSVRSALAEV
jgi:putative ABC transport system permease protein